MWGVMLALACVAAPGLAADAPHADCPKPKDHPAAGGPLRVVFFYSLTCGQCQKAKAAVAAAGGRWGDRIHVEMRETGDRQVLNDLLFFEEHYNLRDTETLVVFVGRRALGGLDAIVGDLNKAIEAELAAGATTFLPGSGDKVRKKFEGFTVWVIIGAGLLDGINPCAFTTIVFLLSMLSYLGKSKRQLAAVGMGFTVAVFVTYFLLGLGVLGAFKALMVSQGISRALGYAVAAMAFALAIWSVVDVIRFRRSGSVKSMTLGLPKSVKSRIHKVIRVGLSTRGLLVGSLSVGFVVAVLESICTGQVYLPTIKIILQDPDLRVSAMTYLALYNLMFIAPLVGVLAVAYYGVSSERLGHFLSGNLIPLKLAMAVLFAGLGVVVLLTA